MSDDEVSGGEAWVLRFALASTFVGGTGALVATDYWETVTNDLTLHAVLVAVPFWLLVLGGAFAFTRKRASTTAWILVALAAVALPGWAVVLAHGCNSELDDTLSIRQVELLEKRSVKNGKSTFLSAWIAPWPPLSEPIVLGLQSATYDRLPARGPIRARVGDGWLGYPWIDDLEPVEGDGR